MPYVVKATGATGNVCWLSAANAEGFRTLAGGVFVWRTNSGGWHDSCTDSKSPASLAIMRGA
jgi:hypothetical protein